VKHHELLIVNTVIFFEIPKNRLASLPNSAKAIVLIVLKIYPIYIG